MKNLFKNHAPSQRVATKMGHFRNSQDTAKPHGTSGQAPTGAPRCGDEDQNLSSNLSFWQLDPERIPTYQL